MQGIFPQDISDDHAERAAHKPVEQRVLERPVPAQRAKSEDLHVHVAGDGGEIRNEGMLLHGIMNGKLIHYCTSVTTIWRVARMH